MTFCGRVDTRNVIDLRGNAKNGRAGAVLVTSVETCDPVRVKCDQVQRIYVVH